MKVLAAIAAVLLMSRAALAQEGARPQAAAPTFRSASAMVALSVTVQDRDAKFVHDLRAEDFVVYENGVKQDVQFFESSRVPMDLIVLIDTSMSMRDKLSAVHEAASGFLATLRPGDRGAVVSFASRVEVLQALTEDRALLDKAVRGTQASGDTSLNNAVYVALKQFGQAARQDGHVRRQAIVLLSDGADTTSMVSFDDVVALARRVGVGIYAVSLQSQAERAQETTWGRRSMESADAALRTLAKETGGQSFFAMPATLKSVYGSIASELASQYSIGYAPIDARSDGSFRRISVQVVTRPNLTSRTRLGYIAGTAVGLAAAPGAGGR